MGGEQKPAHHRLGRGGKKPIVIIGTTVVFFVLLSMTGLGHSHNHVEREMPAHAALSGRRAGRYRPERADDARTRHGGHLHGAHDVRERHRAHDGLFGRAVDDAIETRANTWMHEVVDPIVDTMHDSAEGGRRGGAGARQHGLGGASSGEGSEHKLLFGAERAADAVGGLRHAVDGFAHLAHESSRDAAHLSSRAELAGETAFRRDADTGDPDDPDDPVAKMAALSRGLNPAHGAREGATDPRLIWHPPPRGFSDRDAGKAGGREASVGAVTSSFDSVADGLAVESSTSDDESSAFDDGTLDVAVDDENDDVEDDRRENTDTRRVNRSAAAMSGVHVSCERCSHHGTCALGGDCQCTAMFEGKACRMTRALEKLGASGGANSPDGAASDPLLDGFSRGFGGSMTLTRENAPAMLEARPVASGAAARNAGIAAEESLEVEDDWTRVADPEDDAGGVALARRFDGRSDVGANGGVSAKASKASAGEGDRTRDFVADGGSLREGSSAGSSARLEDESARRDAAPAPPAPPAKFGKITRNTRERLPERGPFDESVFTRCALVGRGGFHASARPEDALGLEVDAHDAVFRFGDDPVIGYENVVGSRTTFRLVVDDQDTNPLSQYLGEALPRREKGATSVAVGSSDVVSSVSEKKKDDGPAKTVRFVRDSVSFKRYLAARLAKPELDIHVAHPDFIAWVDGAVASAGTRGPSPELYGALVAAHKCREVNLYGFQTQSFAGAEDTYHGAHGAASASETRDFSRTGDGVSDSAAGTDAAESARTPSLDPLEWSVLTRMASGGVLHFAEPCVVACHENAAACDACVADPESSQRARAAVGRARSAEKLEAAGVFAADDSEKSVGASLDHWMSDVAGALARSGFEKAENEKNAFSSSGRPERERTAGGGETTASVASAVFARGAEDAFGAARETTAFVSSATDLSELDDVASVSESSRDARGGGDDDDDAFVGRTR